MQKWKNIIDKFTYQRVISQISAYRNIEGWLTDREAFGLYSISRKVETNGIVVEIGSWKGKSTYCIARGLKNGSVYAIDPFNAIGEPGSSVIYEKSKGERPLLEQFNNTMRDLGVIDKIIVCEGFSKQFTDYFRHIDFLFIDGDHSIEGCDYDFMNFAPLIRKGGYIAFHDYDPARNDLGPTWVINNRIDNASFRFYNRYDTLWVGRKLV